MSTPVLPNEEVTWPTGVKGVILKEPHLNTEWNSLVLTLLV